MSEGRKSHREEVMPVNRILHLFVRLLRWEKSRAPADRESQARTGENIRRALDGAEKKEAADRPQED